jgi:taurine transport system permease protein
VRRLLTGRPLVGRLLSLVVLLGTWSLVVRLGIWSDLLVPSPGQVWDAFVQSATSDGPRHGLSGYLLWEHLWASVWRIARGVFWALVVGLPLGLLLGSVRAARVIVEPYVSFLRSLPPLAYFSLLIIWFGIEDTSKVWLLFLAAFPPIALATMAGVQRVRVDFVEAAESLGASRLQVVRHVVVPSVVPDVLVGVRLALGFAWTTIVAAETTNGIPGIGGLAWATKKQNRSDIAIMAVLVTGITALALDHLVQRVERRFVPWRGRA